MATITSSSAALSFSNLASSRSSSFTGSSLPSPPASFLSPQPVASLSCRAQKFEFDASLPRRSALSLLAALAAASSRVSPADAAYGEAANIFGTVKVDSGFVPVSGSGFKLNIPSKWNPSKEIEFPGTVLRYEDNFDGSSNISVMILPDAKSSITEYGSPRQFLETVSYLLGRQAYSGKTRSEGGFDRDAVVTAAILETYTPIIDGKDYYRISVLTRTADGDEGGKHHLIVGTISGGKLYLCKAQSGDKRWFKGSRKFLEGATMSFNVA